MKYKKKKKEVPPFLREADFRKGQVSRAFLQSWGFESRHCHCSAVGEGDASRNLLEASFDWNMKLRTRLL